MRRQIFQNILRVTVLASAALFAPTAHAYSAQSHQQLIDLSWKPAIEPLLRARFPGVTDAQLREAHAYAYGGCAIQDLGYYPFGEEFFSNLAHYVRSGDLVQALLADARTPDELAFAIGALSHYVGDSLGHSIATNYAVPVEFSKLRHRFGDWVTYDEDPHAHTQAEFAFDVNEISKQRFAPVSYLESVGLEVPLPLLSRAFEEVYGLSLTSVVGGGQRPNLFGYRASVHRFIPRIGQAEALLHHKDMPPDSEDQAFKTMVRDLRQSGVDNGWQQFRHTPDAGTYVLAGLIWCMPKVGVFSMLDIKGPTPQTENDYVRSMDRCIETMRFLLANQSLKPLINRDLDTGQPVRAGAYRLTDTTYQQLLHRLTHKAQHPAPAALKANITAYYSNRAAFGDHLSNQQWTEIQTDLKLLNAH